MALIEVATREEGQEEEEQVGAIPALPHQRMLRARISATMTPHPIPSQHILPKVRITQAPWDGGKYKAHQHPPSLTTATFVHNAMLVTTSNVYKANWTIEGDGKGILYSV